MDLQALNIDLFGKLSLALAIIRNTPTGIQPDLFARSLAKRLFSTSNDSHRLMSLLDEHLLLRQRDLLTRLVPLHSSLSTSHSSMDVSMILTSSDSHCLSSNNEYEYGDFAEKVCQLKARHYHLKIHDIEFLLNMLKKWIIVVDIDNRELAVDACLYTLQIIANKLQIDNDKPYHVVLDLLPLIDKFLDCLLDRIERTADDNIVYLQQMVIGLCKTYYSY
jgi:hypothetical protein